MGKSICAAFVLIAMLAFPALAKADVMEQVLVPGVCVVDADDPTVVFFERAANERFYPGSTTKIMTCILALECASLQDTVTVSKEAASLGSDHSLMGLVRGEQLSMEQLMYGLMLVSGNDAAIAIAEKIDGSVSAFAQRMNQKALALGMTGTHFTNASGVYHDNHYSTPRDMAILTAYALKNEAFREIVATQAYTIPASQVRAAPIEMLNSNALLSDPPGSELRFDGTIGVKTGSTTKGGKCYVAAAQRDGHTVIAVMLGLLEGGGKSTRTKRCFTDAILLMDEALKTGYVTVTQPASELGFSYEARLPVINGTGESVSVYASTEGLTASLYARDVAAVKESPQSVTVYATIPESLTAPVQAGEVLGMAEFMLEGRVLLTAPMIAGDSVDLAASLDDEALLTEPSPGLSTGQNTAQAQANNQLLKIIILLSLAVLGVILLLLRQIRRKAE